MWGSGLVPSVGVHCHPGQSRSVGFEEDDGRVSYLYLSFHLQQGTLTD